MIFSMSPSTLSPTLPAVDALVIRPAYSDDAPTLARLAALDSQRPLAGSMVVAERDGRILAAITLDGSRTIADPFAPTADLVALLRLHAADTARSFAGRRDILRRVGANTRRNPALARG
jgi:hypothetical protein